jgi:hypothetical protein
MDPTVPKATRPGPGRNPCGGLAAALVLAALAVPVARAQPVLLVSDSSTPPGAREKSKWNYVPLRPNQEQEFYLFVRNATPRDETVTVSLRSGDGQREWVTSKAMTVKSGATEPVAFPPAPAAPAPAAGQPAPPPGVELTGPPFDYRFVLLDAKNQPFADSRPLPVKLLSPDQYLEIPTIEFSPRQNQLRVTVQSRPDFSGPPAPVDLVLLPERIPGLRSGVTRDGAYHRALTGPNRSVSLTANNLPFTPERQTVNGLVYLTVDGYARAFTFNTTFHAVRGLQRSERIDQRMLGLSAPRYQQPQARCPVTLEVDNADLDVTSVEVGLDRDKDGSYAEDEVKVFPAPRERHIFARPLGNGRIAFVTQVRDWTYDLDTAGVFGERPIRLRLLEPAREAGAPPRAVEVLDPRELLGGRGARPKTEVFYNLAFDDTPPVISRLDVVLGQKTVQGKPVNVVASDKDAATNVLVRGKRLKLVAVADDPESHIKRAVFFLGKPTADLRIPDTAARVEGEAADEARTTWEAPLDAPTDRPAVVQVSVQVTNGAGITQFGTIEIRLVDAPPSTKPAALPRIEGRVVDGGGRAQPNVRVNLTDGMGTVKDTVTTNDSGTFVFKDVAPGSYRVLAARRAVGLVGETSVQVAAGEDRTGVVVRLRLP